MTNLNKHISNFSLRVSLFASNLTKMEKEMINNLFELQSTLSYDKFTIATLSEALNVSSTSLHRISKKLGYSSFILFKEDFFTNAIGQSNVEKNKESLRLSIDNTLELVEQTLTKDIIECISSAQKITVYGMGINSLIAKIFQLKLQLSGFIVDQFDDSRFMRLSAKNLKKDEDVIIILSRSGNPPELIEVMKQAILNNVATILITETIGSILEDMATYIIRTGSSADDDSSIDTRIPAHIAVDIIANRLLEKQESEKVNE